jgi:pyruvate,orthophosphate dikinase
VRIETSPDDIHGMHAAKGILTTRGGMTSHAAVVARGMGRPCVVGAGDLRVDYAAGKLTVGGVTAKAGDIITIDGATGEVILGELATIQPELSGDFSTIMDWADAVRRMKIYANADTPSDVKAARGFGCEGVGLCRTEHMFFDGDRIVAVREMILASDVEGRRVALAKLLPMQRRDFIDIFDIMRELPVTIRLLDPPLHEFLPKTDAEVREVASVTGQGVETIRHRAAALHEANPMLGHRGCRLGITSPEIYEMQVRAIFEAAAHVTTETGTAIAPEIMIPLVATKREVDILKAMIDRLAGEIVKTTSVTVPYLVGTMIELPRAALRAGEIAQTAEFFSFGTNDLTQTCLGLSRDDAGSFLGAYQKAGILDQDPFVTIDRDGVGELMKMGIERGRATRKDLKVGVCGEHGGDPASIAFCETLGLDYVSCSPYRVPIARLAAAQAALARRGTDGLA